MFLLKISSKCLTRIQKLYIFAPSNMKKYCDTITTLKNIIMKKSLSKKSLLLGCGMLLALNVSAQNPVLGRGSVSKVNAATSVEAMKNAKGGILSVNVSKPVEGRYTAVKDNKTPIYLLEEDFANLTAGSYGAPDLSTPLWYDREECEHVWQNMKEGYTNIPKWGCEYVYSAGGMAYMRAVDQTYNFARLNTPMLDCSGNDRVIYLQFDARTKEGQEVPRFWVEFAETNNMSANWGNTGGGIVEAVVTDQWQTYTVTLEGTGPSSIFNIASSTDFTEGASAELYIDNLKIYQVKPVIARPVALPHSQYKGTSFTANWNAVENAVSYNVDVFTIEGETEVPVLEMKDVKGTSVEISGVESGAIYYYTVSAVDASGNVSRKSFPIRVFDLEAPQLTETSINNEGIYTASWNKVPAAEVYNYYAAYKRTVKEDGPVYVTDENMDNVKFEGNEPTFDPVADPASINDAYPGHYTSYSIGSDFAQAGWMASQYTPCKGYVAVDAFFNISTSLEPMGSIQSPELQLGKDGGKFTVQLSLAAEGKDLEGWTDENGNPMQGIYYPKAAVAVFTYDEAVGDYVQKEMQYQELSGSWENYEFNFTTGTERTIVGIFVTRVPALMFIDDLRIIQNAKVGDVYNEPFCYERYYLDGLSIDIEVPSRAKGEEIWHKVAGVRSTENGEIKEGVYSDYRKVGVAEHTDIQNSIKEHAFVAVEGNAIHVNNPAGEDVEVYSVDGKFIAADRTGNTNVVIGLTNEGAYLVKVGKQTVKLVY